MGPQTLRNTPNTVFQNQQPQAQRNGGVGSSRLQNGKIGGSQSWGFGLGAAGTSNLSNQPRSNNGLSGFAQAIGGSGSQASLDLSTGSSVNNLASIPYANTAKSRPPATEFPSLSGAPSGQQNSTASQAIWGNQSSRVPPNPPSQRSQRANAQNSSHNVQPGQQGNQSRSRQDEHDSHSSAFSHIPSNTDDFRYPQNGLGQHIRSDPRGNGDDFPPLSGLGGGDYDMIRRGESGHEYQTNGNANGVGFSAIPSSTRSSTLAQLDGRSERANQPTDRIFSPSDNVSRATPSSRLVHDQSETEGFPRSDQTSVGRISRNSGPGSLTQSQLPYRSNQLGDHPQRLPQAHTSGEMINEPTGYSQMSDIDKFGLPGLMELLRGNVSTDQAAIALGMDLNTLGLNLQKPGNSPLHTDWAGPFSDPAGPPVIPDFSLPPAYTVSNVPALHTKITDFSDDTLFMIFYQMPRDEAQELAALELYRRDWRWHKGKMQWMMKCRDAPDPQVMPSRTEERGWYYFWDPQMWRRDRKEFILQYEHLYHPISALAAEEAMNGGRGPA